MEVLDFYNAYVSGIITRGNMEFSLPYYAEVDRVESTLPPHVGDIFVFELPVTVPCIATLLSMSLSIPEFISDPYTQFLVNITNVTYELPPNLLFVTELCNYQTSNSSSCTVNVTSDRPIIVESEMQASGVDQLFIDFGPIIYNVTTEENCSNVNPLPPDCACFNDTIFITVTARVVSNMQCENLTVLDDDRMQCFMCENQTLADNIRWEVDYTNEATLSEMTFDQGLEPLATIVNVDDDQVMAINASTPAMYLSVNSFIGDAGDSYNLTFGVQHNTNYSSFSAYDLNYTVTVNKSLDPDFFATVCHSNSTGQPFICEDVYFDNRTLNRTGSHSK